MIVWENILNKLKITEILHLMKKFMNNLNEMFFDAIVTQKAKADSLVLALAQWSEDVKKELCNYFNFNEIKFILSVYMSTLDSNYNSTKNYQQVFIICIIRVNVYIDRWIYDSFLNSIYQ